MDIEFIGEKDKFIVIYLDDITIFSQSNAKHLSHLKNNFQKCRQYVLSLNPKKSLFSMQEGKLLGHIVSPQGIKIDPMGVEAIQKINYPINKKKVQSFLGKINFIRRFIPRFAEIVKYITNMLKKDSDIKWKEDATIFFLL